MSTLNKTIVAILGTLLAVVWFLFAFAMLFGFPIRIDVSFPVSAEEHNGYRSATIIQGDLPDEYKADWTPTSGFLEIDGAQRLNNPTETVDAVQEKLAKALKTRTAAEKAVVAARLEAEGIVAAEVAEHARLIEIEVDKLRSQRVESASNGYGTDGLVESYTAPSSPTDSMPAGSIRFRGVTNTYVDSYLSYSAPARGAGLWYGSDSTTDGDWGYFVGHNPGDFYEVMNLVAGDMIYVCDRNGNTRSYRVVDVFTIPDYTYWEDIQERVDGYGESVIVQTCCGDKANYRIAVAVG